MFRERDQVGLVVGFEGEAKADAAAMLGLAGFSFKDITPGMAATLIDCEVVLWPDNDRSGENEGKLAGHVIAVAGHTHSLKTLVPPPELPTAGDIIDAVRDFGWDAQRVLEFLETAITFQSTAAIGSTEESPSGAGRGQPPEVEGWPKPETIQGELPPVGAFSENLLPRCLRPLARDVAERMQVPMDYPAILTILSLAGAVNRRASIQPKANDSSWTVVPNLWGGIIGPPGIMKSPVISAATRPLKWIQGEWRQEHEQTLKNYVWDKEEYDLRRAAWKEQYKQNTKKGRAVPDRPGDEPEEPKSKRLIVNDATFEALHQTMSENPAGILVIRDELTGWWSQLDRAGREGERAFCLSAWNGDTGHTVDRIGRGTVHVDACCISMLGGIQPGRLRSYLVEALEDGPSNDGLIQRFQLLVWPDMSPDWTYVDRAPDAVSEQQAACLFSKLVELDAENPARFYFAPDAQEVFKEFLAELEARVRGNQLHPALATHLSKYRSLMPSLALLFELADLASSEGFDFAVLTKSNNYASLEHAQQAVALCRYLESHAQRIYSCVTTPQIRAAQVLADKIRKRQVAQDGAFSCRDVYLKGWSGVDTPELVRLAVEVLLDAGWIRELEREPGPQRGRPSARYQVNPRVWE